jgi:hypothetical protein
MRFRVIFSGPLAVIEAAMFLEDPLRLSLRPQPPVTKPKTRTIRGTPTPSDLAMPYKDYTAMRLDTCAQTHSE